MRPPVLQIIIGSTRPGRVGPAIAAWFAERAKAHGGFEVELIDIADFGLPLLDEPNHPMARKYTKEHTMRWSATISNGDAFAFVVPEYNHSFNAATKNAIDFLYHEWRFKPAGILSYGGAAMGTRSAQALKPVFAALKLLHAGDVSVPLVNNPVKDGVFHPNEILASAADALLDEIAMSVPALIERRSRAKTTA